MNNSKISIFLLLLLIIPLSACSTQEEKKEKHYLRAMEYLKISEEKAAILELKNAIQLDPKFAGARYQLGLLHLKTGNPQEAFAELQRAFSLDPANADAGVKVAEFLLLAKNTRESRMYVERVLETSRDYPDAVALLANLEMVDGNIQKAEEAIDRAIQLSPDNDRYYNIRGQVLCAQSKFDQGEQAFHKAIELNPSSFGHYRTLLMLYLGRGDDAAAKRLLEIMAPKFPDDPQLHLLQAGLYVKKGEWDKAEQEYLKAIELKKEAVSYRLMLADFYRGRQQLDKAEEYLQKSLADLPNNIELQSALAELLFDTEKFSESGEMMKKILATNPANASANLLKARFLLRDGKAGEAIEVVTPLTSEYPKWGELFYYAALMYLKTGKMELAQKAAETATTNSPGNDRYHALAAQIDLLRNNGVEAGKEAALALKLNPKNFTAAKLLVQSMVLQKDFAKAISTVDSMNSERVQEDVDLLGAVGLAYLGVNDKQASIKAFTRILQLAPDNTKALSLLTALTAGNDLKRATAFVQQHIAAHETAGSYLFLGDLYLRQQQNDLALQAFEKAQALNPADPQAYILQARLLRAMGKIEDSLVEYHELLKSQPDSIQGLMGLAATLEIKGMKAEAIDAYQKVLALKADFPAAANNLAWLLAVQGGDLGEALRLAMLAKQALPNQPNIADTLGWVYYRRGSYNLAISQFKQALEGRPDDPTICYHLALAQHANGEKSEAIALLKKIISKNNEFHEREEANATLQQWQNL